MSRACKVGGEKCLELGLLNRADASASALEPCSSQKQRAALGGR